jgi:peroxiredoxin Q/BCP
LDAQIIGVSTDSIDTHNEFAEKNMIGFPLVSDDDESIKKLYGRGRITYLIDKSGIIRFVKKGVPENTEFMEQLRKFQ